MQRSYITRSHSLRPPYQALRTHISQTSTLSSPTDRNTNQVPSSTTAWEIVEDLSDVSQWNAEFSISRQGSNGQFLKSSMYFGTIMINTDSGKITRDAG